MKNPQPKQRIVLGSCIIIIGVLALINKFNIFNIGDLFQFWPTVFVVIGILKLIDSKGRSSILIALCFILVGVGMMLNNLGIFHFSLHDWWPVILIVIGISVVFKDRSTDHSSNTFFSGDNNSVDDATLDITAVMGGNKTVNCSQNFKGGDITAIMGGVDLDLRGASIQADAVLNLWATWGGIVIKIPQDWVVVNRGMAILGGIEDKSFSSPGSSKRLIITGTAIMGGVEVKN